jgi:AcrR family transcriptional regulator
MDDSPHRLDPRIARSETAIRNALLEQLRSGRNFTSLTVSEIAEHANVTRKTFYARVGSLDQLVERMVLDLFKEISSQIDDRMLIMPVVGNTLSIMVLGQCEEHKAVLAPLVRRCSASLFMEPLSEVLAHMLARVTEVNQTPKLEPVEQAYLVAAIALQILSIRYWSRGYRRLCRPAALNQRHRLKVDLASAIAVPDHSLRKLVYNTYPPPNHTHEAHEQAQRRSLGP